MNLESFEEEFCPTCAGPMKNGSCIDGNCPMFNADTFFEEPKKKIIVEKQPKKEMEYENCPTCNGLGKLRELPYGDFYTCPTCNGSKQTK